MSPIQQMLLGVGGAAADTKTYIDDIFSTYVYRGNETAGRAINNGINLSGKGGLVWVKSRNDTHDNHLVDTERGANVILESNTSDDQATIANRITGFNSSGFNLGSAGQVNGTSVYKYSSWTWRKCPGFFDIVSYTGNGQNARTISHDLNSVPGLIIVKSLNDDEPFQVLHRSIGPTKYGVLNTNSQFHDNDSRWNDTAPTSTNFTVGTDDSTNKSGTNYIAYIWAGGASTASEAVSVNFDGSDDYLTVASSSDLTFGTGDFTIECWVKPDDFNSRGTFYDSRGSNDTTGITIGHESSSGEVRVYINAADGGDITVKSSDFYVGQWQHVAVTRSSGTVRLFINGLLKDSGTRTSDLNTTNTVRIGYKSYTSSGYSYFDGEISNFRIVKGTAAYTSSFRALTTPLTNITNTKLLCCNNSSVTGKTVGPTITPSDSTDGPTASSNSPFDDPAGFVFGENEDQNVIKCGSYTGNGSSTGPKIDLGWEPQWWLVKRTDASANWQLLDSIRGWPDGGNDAYFIPNETSSEGNYAFGHPSSTGFVLDDSHAAQNADGGKYVYMAIRRPDGYVGKAPELGTDVFNIVTGTSDSSVPGFVTNNLVDFYLYKSSNYDWGVGARLLSKKYWKTNSNAATTDDSNATFDYNNGFGDWTSNLSGYYTWAWTRHAGFDVVTYTGNGSSTGDTQKIPHGLNQVPEMAWIKNRGSTQDWGVYHKDLHSSIPEKYYLKLNTNDARVYEDQTFDPPTATHFNLRHNSLVNANNADFIMLLFSSVSGISKVGSYTGTGSSLTITTGFQPRFIIIKKASGSGANRNWYLLDTTRGWGSGDDKVLLLSDDDAEADNDMGAPTSTGFTLTGETHSGWNASSREYIYYAHA